jgi:hypothetical protein
LKAEVEGRWSVEGPNDESGALGRSSDDVDEPYALELEPVRW